MVTEYHLILVLGHILAEVMLPTYHGDGSPQWVLGNADPKPLTAEVVQSPVERLGVELREDILS